MQNGTEQILRKQFQVLSGGRSGALDRNSSNLICNKASRGGLKKKSSFSKRLFYPLAVICDAVAILNVQKPGSQDSVFEVSHKKVNTTGFESH